MKKVERSVKGPRTKNKDVGKNMDRYISAVTPEAQTQEQVQSTRGPSARKHSPHSIRIWYKHNETEDQEGTRRESAMLTQSLHPLSKFSPFVA